jgi:hypothetical protein
MMKLKLLFVFLAASLGIHAQVVNIPDANFKAKLLSSSPANTLAKNLSGNYFAIDANSDGQIQVAEAQQVGGIEIIDPDTDIAIQSYEGILSFTNIKNIKINYRNVPADLFQVSGLNFLEDLNIKFGNYDPGNINLSSCPLLKNVQIDGITLNSLTNNPLIENLSIAGLAMPSGTMDGIESLNYLKKLELKNFYDTISGLSLNLSSHPNLRSLKIIDTSLANVDVSYSNLLHDITLDSSLNSSININSSNCPSLVDYFVAQNLGISAHIISDNCPSLVNFISPDYGEVWLSFNGCTNLKTIDTRNLRSLSVNNCVNLEKIKALRFRQSTLDLSTSNLQNLKYLEISYVPAFMPSTDYGDLTSLNVQGITSLEELYCANHQISNLNFAGCTNLQILDSSKNQLSTLDVSSLGNLEELYCNGNLLTSLYVKNGKNETLEFANNPNLQYVCCDSSQMPNVQDLISWYAYTNCTVDSTCNTAVLAGSETRLQKIANHTVKIYPIPVKGEATIESDSAILSVELYDAQGKVVQKQITNSNKVKINLQSYPSGAYYFKIDTGKGSLMKKVIKN